MRTITLSISEPVFEDVERLRKRFGYDNRSKWVEYLITRGLEVVRKERNLGEVIGDAPALAGAET